MKFKSDIEVQAGLKDSSGSNGTSGQVLSTTGSTVSWINQTTIANDVQNLVKAGVAINKGQAVYVTGADGTNIIVGLASSTSEATSSKTLGLLNATVAINGMADVVQIGRLAGLNTIGATVGDPVWLGTNGNLIYGLANKPYAPAHLVFLGIVTRVNSNNGEIFVNVQNGFELNEIHDVDLKTNVPINGDVLGYDGTLWVNKTIAEWLGYTPANASGTTNYVSKFTGANSLGDSQIFDNGAFVGIGTATSVGNDFLSIFYNSSTSRNQAINIKDTNASANGSIFSVYRKSDDTYLGAISRNGSSDALFVYGNDHLALGSGATERMRITSSGNVGIGTSSPSEKLTISGGALRLESATGVSSYVHYISPGNDEWSAGMNGAYDFQIAYSNGLGTPRMTLLKGGNVGIGTTSPSAKLESYKGSQSDTISRANSSAYFWGADIGLAIGQSASVPFGTWMQSLKNDNNATFPLSLNPNGSNVGIGTTNPQRKLDIVGNHNTSTFRVYYPELNVAGQDASVDIWASEPGVSFNGSGIGSNVNGQPYYGRTNPALGQGFIRFIDGTTAFHNSSTDAVYAERMRITPGGSVGIGTSSPISKLNVNTTDSANNVITVTNGTQELALGVNNGSGGSFLFENSNNALRLGTVGTERMRITNEGNVGIGTSSPTSVLHIAGGSYPAINIQGGAAGGGGLRMLSGASGSDIYAELFGEYESSNNGMMLFRTRGSGTLSERMRITSSGNVGIGTSNPNASALLDVDSRAQGFLPPRMDTGQRDNIASPAPGLMIFNLDTEQVDVFTSSSGWRTIAWV